ncbi:S9 family peptidase [Nocardioides sp. GY 10113]|uniref:S9 family peptidase n=1 Tax=Nocardioides sp. GY 10113 TaxID=2569761 RepID=UPI0010A821E8|nr:S9 family peptidase [Nocardioides sp. GY 10113]TIC88567.1 S9 family peptidase [Nocardioides sp. GY 10113]
MAPASPASPTSPDTAATAATDATAVPPAAPPVAARRPVTTTHHGRERVDEYDWLRAKEDPEVLGYLEAENAWTDARTAHLAHLRATIYEEIKARTLETDLSVPTRVRGYWYYSRSFEGKQYGASCRVAVTDPADWTPPMPAADALPDQPALPGEEVLLDLNELAEGHEFFSLGGSAVSSDDRILAYATDVVGDERYTVRFLDLVTREHLADELTDVLGGVTWGTGTGHCYYTTVDETWRPDKVWRHRLGTAQSEDELVFHEPDGRFNVGVGRTRSRRFVVVAAGSRTTTEYHLLDAGDPAAVPQVFAERSEGIEYSLDHLVVGGQDRFVVLHNATGPEFELGYAAGPAPAAEWTPLLPHDLAVRLEDVDAFAGHVVVQQRSEGRTRVRVLTLGTDPDDPVVDDRLLELGGELATVGLGGNPSFEQPRIRVGMTSMAQPSSVYDVDLATSAATLLKRAPVLGGYDPADYEEHRLWATAPDGTQVPISLVVRKGARGAGQEGTAQPVPLVLYGYGAYEASMDPYFSISRVSLLDRGAAFAIAHVRGGGEMGRHWYDDGKMENKQHTFDDFIACARHLVAEGWTTADRLVAQGGSAGGLLMGAVANQAPDAFGGIVAEVPFVDALTSMLDSSLPLTIGEYDEWGNPEGDAEAYDRIAGYAPYDNVADLPYPPILAITSLNDTRVLYVEPAKWVARIRATAPGADVLLKTEMAAGHGGVSGRYRAWEEVAFSQAWILDRLGLAGS